jgi:two-component system, NarL family, sensor histidine kinase DesK
MGMVNSGAGREVAPGLGARWLLPGIWLFYLGETLQALVREASGWRRDLGIAALVGFAALYLYGISRGRRYRLTGEQVPLRQRWLILAGLTVLMLAMLPGARYHALAAAVFIAATAGLSLPKRQAAITILVIFGVAEALPYLMPGWRSNGYGLAVALAGLAVWGLRTVLERNQQLMGAQRRLANVAVEEERSRIATDLHDILGHSLTVITMKAELAGRLLDVDLARARCELRDLENLSRDALADVRSTALGLRGVSLPAEIAAARAALDAAGIAADLPSVADEVPSRWRELFAWTIREAVTNVVRHSGASRATVRLTPRSVEVLDDGRGQGAGAGAEGTGLSGLRERARAAGASIELGVRPEGTGFRVYVEVPA